MAVCLLYTLQSGLAKEVSDLQICKHGNIEAETLPLNNTNILLHRVTNESQTMKTSFI